MEMGFREISKHLQIAPSTAHRIYRRFESTSDVGVHKQSGGSEHCKLDDHHELLLITLVAENPCLYFQEMCQKIETATGVKVSGSTVCRVLQKNRFTRKKVQTVAKQRSAEFRGYYMAQILQFNPELLCMGR